VDGSIGAIGEATRMTLSSVDKQVVLVCDHQMLESIFVFLCPVLGAVQLIISLIIEHLQIMDYRLISEVEGNSFAIRRELLLIIIGGLL